MSKHIDDDAFIAEKRALYCKDCDMRMSVYEIGDAPCKSCGINDMLDALDDFPAADVAPVVRCKDCVYYKESKLLAPSKFCFRLKDKDGNSVGYNFSPDDFCSRGEKMDEKESKI